MAKKPKTVTKTTTTETVNLPDDEVPAGLLETGASPGDVFEDPLADLLGLGDDIRWTVFKISGKPGDKGGYCDVYTGDSLTLEVLRDTWGGGRFRIRGARQDGTYAGQKTVDVMQPVKAATQQPMPLVQPAMSEIAQLIAAMRPTDGGGDKVLAAMTAMLDSQSKMLGALLSRPAPEGPKLLDVLALIKSGKDEGGTKSAIELLTQGIALGRDLSGGGGSDDPLALGGKALDLIRTAIEKGPPKAAPAAAAPAATLPKPAAAPPSAAPTNGAAAPPEESVDVQKLNWLRMQTASLVMQAAKQRDPEVYAVVMLDNLPEFVTEEEIQQRMAAPNAVDQLALIDSRVGQFREWFEEFRAITLELLSEEEEPPAPAAPAAPLPDGTGGDDVDLLG